MAQYITHTYAKEKKRMFNAICNGDFEEVQRIVKKDHGIVHIKDCLGWTPLDVVIASGKLDIAKFLFEKDGRPNLDIYHCDKKYTPVHHAVLSRHTDTLKWAFTKNVLSLDVLKNEYLKMTPLDYAIYEEEWETAALIQRLIHLDPVFLAMQRAKRDYHQMCVLRRLPDELLDMVVDEVAARFHIKVVWH